MSSYHRVAVIVGGVAALAIAILTIVFEATESSGAGAPGKVGGGHGGIRLKEIGEFNSPTNVAFAPGEGNKVYVVEQAGTVRVIVNGRRRSQPFLNIKGRVLAGGERGLLSIAFHPGYRHNHAVYAYYTNHTGDIEVDEFKTSSATHARGGSRRKVISIRHRFADNHNGGQLAFDRHGLLHLGTGDGGAGDDPRENGQDKGSLLGKLLRIRVDGHGGGYTSPAGNPYVGRKGRDEIVARGLRNPYRFSFDSKTGRIVIGDVGQGLREEVDYERLAALPGANFGWDRWEGTLRHDAPGDNESSTPDRRHHDKPIHQYSHNDGRCAIIGGFVVRDKRLRSLYGRYLYSDNCDGKLRSLVPRLGHAKRDRKLGRSVSSPSSFGEAKTHRHTIYVASLNGPVYRLLPKR